MPQSFRDNLIKAGLGMYAPKHSNAFTSANSRSTQRTIPRISPVVAQSAIPWAEYNNPQNHRYTYSPTLHKQRQAYAKSVFDRAERILLAAYKEM